MQPTCPHCGKGFSRKDNVIRHMRSTCPNMKKKNELEPKEQSKHRMELSAKRKREKVHVAPLHAACVEIPPDVLSTFKKLRRRPAESARVLDSNSGNAGPPTGSKLPDDKQASGTLVEQYVNSDRRGEQTEQESSEQVLTELPEGDLLPLCGGGDRGERGLTVFVERVGAGGDLRTTGGDRRDGDLGDRRLTGDRRKAGDRGDLRPTGDLREGGDRGDLRLTGDRERLRRLGDGDDEPSK
ncbi:hypothetical protein FQA39_LY17309 [Lamprigera yunnana]|nr:hypothetical protein FQA39_LY17309 [Lamprigera yunnana]